MSTSADAARVRIRKGEDIVSTQDFRKGGTRGETPAPVRRIPQAARRRRSISLEILWCRYGTVIAPAVAVAAITMWRRDERCCVLLVGEGRARFTLRVMDGTSVVRSEGMTSADQAFLVAEMWREQERESVYGAVPPL